MSDKCRECGMLTEPNDYHPYAACLMFKACNDGRTVRANLEAVRANGAENNPDSTRLQRAEELLWISHAIIRTCEDCDEEAQIALQKIDAYFGERNDGS